MAVTIKQIAEKSGVSRGTVDRVLNHRGNVNTDTKQLVEQVARDLGYTPNKAGKALAARKKNYTIGIILCSEGNEFFDDVIRGIEYAKKDASDYGITVTLKTAKGFNVNRQLELIDELEREMNLLILNAIQDEKIIDRIKSLSEKNIPVITINSDVPDSLRLCHVGSDGIKSGETAAGMLGLITDGLGKILIATGNNHVLGHNQRMWGFCSRLNQKYPGMTIADTIETQDDDDIAYSLTKQALMNKPEISAVYINAGAAIGVCRAISELERNDLTVIACDYTRSMEALMRTGQVKVTICQQPFTQGRRSVELAVDYLVNGTLPEKTVYDMKNEIRIFENCNG